MAVWTPMPSVIFGVMGLLSGFAMFLLPETLNRKLPDTIAEAEEIGRYDVMIWLSSNVLTRDNKHAIIEPRVAI